MSKSRESYNKKEVKKRKEKKRKEKEERKLAKKEAKKKGNLEDMMAYIDENGVIISTPPDPAKKKSIELEDIQISSPKHDTTMDFDPNRKGTVSFFNESKGFGFINDSETQESVFVHANNVLEEIKEGDYVCFKMEKGPKGPIALNVKPFNKS